MIYGEVETCNVAARQLDVRLTSLCPAAGGLALPVVRPPHHQGAAPLQTWDGRWRLHPHLPAALCGLQAACGHPEGQAASPRCLELSWPVCTTMLRCVTSQPPMQKPPLLSSRLTDGYPSCSVGHQCV